MCVRVCMCEGEKERERKGGEGGSGLRQGAREKTNVRKTEKGQTERYGGVKRVFCQDDASGFVGTSKHFHYILILKMSQPCIIFFPL